MYPLLDAILSFIAVTSIVWLPLLMLSVLSTKLVSLLGRRVTMCMGAIGVPVHELSHAAMALLMNHKIVGIALFQPNSDGTLGYVNHAYRKTFFSPFALLLIALAPLLGAYIAIYFATLMLRPDLIETLSRFTFHVYDWQSAQDVMGFLSSTLIQTDQFWSSLLWGLCIFSIALFAVPSRADFQHCRSGVLALLATFLATALLFQPVMDSLVSIISGSLMLMVWPLYLCLIVLTALLLLALLSRMVRIHMNVKNRSTFDH